MFLDFVIVGAGPGGLALAYYLSKANPELSILIIEKEAYIGGAHHAKFEPLFTEHSPRVYFDSYGYFKAMLKDMGADFYQLFTKYHFGLQTILKESALTFRESMILFGSLLLLGVADTQITMEDYCNHHHFSDRAKWFIDRLCRLSDGAEIERYTLYEFLQIINQNALYSIYQPRVPTSQGFLKLWRQFLESRKVNFRLNTQLSRLDLTVKTFRVSDLPGADFYFGKMILAMAPLSIVAFLDDFGYKNAFGPGFDRFAKASAYLQYISVTFHWKQKLTLARIYGFPSSSWGVGFIVLSDYMNFGNEQSQTVISAAVSVHEKSDVLGKTPNECSQKELVDEVFRQLKLSFPELPNADSFVQSESSKRNHQWEMHEQAFVLTRHGYQPQESPEFPNALFCSGPHTGKSDYTPTTLESALQNAFVLASKFYPGIKRPSRSWTVRQAISAGVVGLMVLGSVISLTCVL